MSEAGLLRALEARLALELDRLPLHSPDPAQARYRRLAAQPTSQASPPRLALAGAAICVLSLVAIAAGSRAAQPKDWPATVVSHVQHLPQVFQAESSPAPAPTHVGSSQPGHGGAVPEAEGSSSSRGLDQVRGGPAQSGQSARQPRDDGERDDSPMPASGQGTAHERESDKADASSRDGGSDRDEARPPSHDGASDRDEARMPSRDGGSEREEARELGGDHDSGRGGSSSSNGKD